jgi:hypothetical protein
MEKPSLGAWFIPVITAGFAVVTAFAVGHSVHLTLIGAGVSYAVLVIAAVGAYFYQRHDYAKSTAEAESKELKREERQRQERKKEREEDREAARMTGDAEHKAQLERDRVARLASLDTFENCQGKTPNESACGQAPTRKRDLWRLPARFNRRIVCAECFTKYVGKAPEDGNPESERAHPP